MQDLCLGSACRGINGIGGILGRRGRQGHKNADLGPIHAGPGQKILGGALGCDFFRLQRDVRNDGSRNCRGFLGARGRKNWEKTFQVHQNEGFESLLCVKCVKWVNGVDFC